MQAILVALASASAFVAHAPRCATSQAPRSAPAKAVLSVNPDDDEPLDFRKEIDELKVVTEGLARKTGALSSKVDLIDKETKMLMIDRLDANQNFLASAVAKNFTMLDQYFRYETKAETETEQNPLAISANDETFPENGKLQLKNMASMILPQKALTKEEFDTFAIVFICGVLTSFFKHF